MPQLFDGTDEILCSSCRVSDSTGKLLFEKIKEREISIEDFDSNVRYDTYILGTFYSVDEVLVISDSSVFPLVAHSSDLRMDNESCLFNFCYAFTIRLWP